MKILVSARRRVRDHEMGPQITTTITAQLPQAKVVASCRMHENAAWSVQEIWEEAAKKLVWEIERKHGTSREQLMFLAREGAIVVSGANADPLKAALWKVLWV